MKKGRSGGMSGRVTPLLFRRDVEGKGRDVRQEMLAALRLHLVIADHEAGRGRQRAAAGVFNALARFEHRLLADNPRPAYFFEVPTAVGDPPMAIAQLYRLGAAVLDVDMVGPDVVAVGRRGMLFEVEWPDRD